MKQRLTYLQHRSWVLALLLAMAAAAQSPSQSPPVAIESPGLRMTIDPHTGLPGQIRTQLRGATRDWLSGTAGLQVRNQITGTQADLARVDGKLTAVGGQGAQWEGHLRELPLRVIQLWAGAGEGVAWDLDFEGADARVEHQVRIELPLLSTNLLVFTPSERGAMQVQAYPSFKPSAYAANGWDNGGATYVLPLISLFDPQTDQALTVALPADANIPHLQFEWREAHTLTVTLARRGMGGGRPSPLRLLWFAHAADYRCVLKAYSDAFPAWFRTTAQRGQGEGTFYYHHIQDHPDFGEMERQRVRFLWSSFWFTHLGEYLPEVPAWEPYTYAKWWKLDQTMTDAKILEFVRNLREHDIRTYAYFNLTEYGGAGGKSGDTAEAARILRDKFANALIKDAAGHDIPTWEGAMAMNPGSRYALWPFLEDQVRRHLKRLPGIEGFVIDRLDWASVLDYGHDDGLSMVGNRPVENMALPVREAVREVARLAHGANLKVFVNQFYRVEPLENADGVCHENDYLPALGYLTPLRPASAWHHQKPYGNDLLEFEAQLKRRLYWALFPQMIAHEYPISQQPPNARAAELLELYAPLFDTLVGKEQVLLPHCVEATGGNDVNLFRTPAGYVAAITSRTRFLSRQAVDLESLEIVVRVPDAGELRWGHAVAVDGRAELTGIQSSAGLVRIQVTAHSTATMVVLGKGGEPDWRGLSSRELEARREKLFGSAGPIPSPGQRPSVGENDHLFLRVAGTHVGTPGPVVVRVNGQDLGAVSAHSNRALIAWYSSQLPPNPPQITLASSDEGTWFIPDRIELLARGHDRAGQRLGLWQSGMPTAATSGPTGSISLPMIWQSAPLQASSAKWISRGALPDGRWQKQLGSQAVWIPKVTGNEKGQNGWRLEVQNGQAFAWSESPQADPRVLLSPGGGRAAPTCWFANDCLRFRLVAPDVAPYRLGLYWLDYDRNGRAMEVKLADDFNVLDTQQVQTTETAGGVCVQWAARGSVNIEIRKLAGFNMVLSGIFVD